MVVQCCPTQAPPRGMERFRRCGQTLSSADSSGSLEPISSRLLLPGAATCLCTVWRSGASGAKRASAICQNRGLNADSSRKRISVSRSNMRMHRGFCDQKFLHQLSMGRPERVGQPRKNTCTHNYSTGGRAPTCPAPLTGTYVRPFHRNHLPLHPNSFTGHILDLNVE